MSIVKQSASQKDSPFDSIRHIDEGGIEFWLGRELQSILGYVKWQKFKSVIENATENLETVTGSTIDHFLPVEVKSNGRPAIDYKLSRLACYHVALCCDSRGNDAVKMAKHYFAVKTREAEVLVPSMGQEIQALQLQNEILEKQLRLRELDHAMLITHGDRVVLALRGLSNQVVEKETVVTEVLNPRTGETKRFLSADQLKKAVNERTGQKLKSMKQFTDALRKAGRDDLLLPVERAQTYEYVQPDKLDEAIKVVYQDCRQKLLGE